MSGGSYDYAYCKIEELSEAIRDNDNPRRSAFKKILKLCAQAARAIEWVDSGDYGPGDEDAAIDTVFKALKIEPEDAYKVAAWDRVAAVVRAVPGSEKGESRGA